MTRTLDDFARIMGDQLDIPGDARHDAEAGLFDDWALDSLRAFELVIRIEALADTLVPPAEVPVMMTVGDAYAYYLSCLAGADLI